jgi:predicted nucleic acid-binding protein
MHFLADSENGPSTFAEFLAGADVLLVGMGTVDDVSTAAALIHKYADTPMDFADASLVLAADTARVTDVLTLDRRGFSTYRTLSGKRFRLVL